MKSFISLVSATMLIAGSSAAMAATYDGSKPLLCAIHSVTECIVGEGCQKVSPESVNLLNFVQVDTTNKVLSARPESGDTRTTPIEYSEHLDGKLILQGADEGLEDIRDGLAWSIAIDETTGKMVVSASGDGFALVMFGACALR